MTGDRKSEREERIRHRAYTLWEGEGRPEGRHSDHWDQAERESDGMSDVAEPWSVKARPMDRYSEDEQPGGGAPDPASAEPQALAQAGEGVPEVTDEDEQPIAATPEDEPARRGTVADIPVTRGRRGSRTGP